MFYKVHVEIQRGRDRVLKRDFIQSFSLEWTDYHITDRAAAYEQQYSCHHRDVYS